ncbi:MAG: hypothetical protein NVSMB19_17670 [Vulcanimicrobiaceae bacterium]
MEREKHGAARDADRQGAADDAVHGPELAQVVRPDGRFGVPRAPRRSIVGDREAAAGE